MAIDAVAAQMMGFDPMEIDYIAHATERGLGTGKADEIEVYTKREGADMAVLGTEKSHVSYYALLKDFVLQSTGGGRGRDKVIESKLEEPTLVRMWKAWKKRMESSKE